MAAKFWMMRLPRDWEVSVQQLPNGRWLGDMRLKSAVDPTASSAKQETFSNVRDALAYVGYPVEVLDLPEELVT